MATGGGGIASKGPEGSFHEHFLAYKALLSRTVGRIVRPQEIEDIVQETFVLSFAASRNHEIRNPRAYMMKVARHVALDHVSKADYRLNNSMEDVDEGEFLSQADATEAEYLSETRFLAFCRAVADLPVGCRRAFILKKVYGLSQKEISEQLGISQNTVEKHVGKGMFMVLQYMVKTGHSTEINRRGERHHSEEVKNLD